VNYDAAFRDIVRGVDLLASGRGKPDLAKSWPRLQRSADHSGILLDQPRAEGVLGFDLSPAEFVLVERHALQADADNAVHLLDRGIFGVAQDRRPLPADIVFERHPDAARIDQQSAVMLSKHMDNACDHRPEPSP
jgi:hypothetical protein